MAAESDADLPRDWDSANRDDVASNDGVLEDDDDDSASLNGAVPFRRSSATSSSGYSSSNSDSDSDLDSDTDDTVSPPRARRRRKGRQRRRDDDLSQQFRRRLDAEMFWDVRDKRFQHVPLSMFFVEECVGNCNYKVKNAYDFIQPGESQTGLRHVPTENVLRNPSLFVTFKDTTFFLAIKKLREHLKPSYDIRYFTLPFTLPTSNQGDNSGNNNEVGEHVAHKFNKTHAEALHLFVVAVYKMSQVLALLQDADSRGTAVGSRLYTSVRATAYMETVREHIWILNNRFAYDKSIGGFYDRAQTNKVAIALMNSLAAATRVSESASTVRSSTAKQAQMDLRKRQKTIWLGEADTEGPRTYLLRTRAVESTVQKARKPQNPCSPMSRLHPTTPTQQPLREDGKDAGRNEVEREEDRQRAPRSERKYVRDVRTSR